MKNLLLNLVLIITAALVKPWSVMLGNNW